MDGARGNPFLILSEEIQFLTAFMSNRFAITSSVLLYESSLLVVAEEKVSSGNSSFAPDRALHMQVSSGVFHLAYSFD